MSEHKTYTFEDMQKKWDAHNAWRKNHKVFALAEDVFDFFRYRIPFVLSEAKHEVIYAWDRVFKGYDSKMVWSLYSEHSKMMVAVLTELRNNHHGSPMPDKEEEGVDIHKLWESQLDEMIAGFQAVLDIEELEWGDAFDKKKQKELTTKFEHGMKLFTKYYRNLWD